MTNEKDTAAASAEIDAKINSLSDWRGEMLRRLRSVIRAADPGIVEEVKWRKPSNPGGVPVWSHDGMICTGETYKAAVKLTFAKGASLDDPSSCSTRALKETRAGPSTSMKATRSTKQR